MYNPADQTKAQLRVLENIKTNEREARSTTTKIENGEDIHSYLKKDALYASNTLKIDSTSMNIKNARCLRYGPFLRQTYSHIYTESCILYAPARRKEEKFGNNLNLYQQLPG